MRGSEIKSTLAATMRWLLPQHRSFYDFFEEHAAVTLRGCSAFLALVSEGDDPARAAEEIRQLEHEADAIARQSIEQLHRVFLTPFDRDVIHGLITRMDDVIDLVEEASDRFALFELSGPAPDAKELASLVVQAVVELQAAVGGLRHLDAEQIRLRCSNIDDLEHRADAAFRVALARLFKEHTDALVIMKWREIYQHLEDATDRCKQIADLLEDIIMEQG